MWCSSSLLLSVPECTTGRWWFTSRSTVQERLSLGTDLLSGTLKKEPRQVRRSECGGRGAGAWRERCWYVEGEVLVCGGGGERCSVTVVAVIRVMYIV